MTVKRTYKRYPKEFKEEAVALVREQGYTVSLPSHDCLSSLDFL